MSSRFIQPFFDAGAGITPADGAKLYFFASDQVTPKDTYSDQLSTPTANANPVIADANGLFGDIFIVGAYYVVLKDKNNVQKWVGDPVTETAEVTGANFDKNFATLALAVADTGLVDGDSINLKERTTGNGGGAMWDVVLSPTVTENTYNIVQCTGVGTLSLVLRVVSEVILNQWGIPTDGSDASPSMLIAATYASANGVQRITGDGSKTYQFDTPFQLDGLSDLDINWNGATLTDNVQGDETTSPFRPNHFLSTYTCENVTFRSFAYVMSATRAAGTPSLPIEAFWIGGQGASEALPTINIKILDFTANCVLSDALFLSPIGEVQGLTIENGLLTGDWYYGCNLEFGSFPTDPASNPDPESNSTYPYNVSIKNFNGINLLNCVAFFRTGGTYNVIMENCQGINVPNFIVYTGGDQNVVRGSQNTIFNNIKTLVDPTVLTIAHSAVQIAINDEYQSAPLPSWTNLAALIEFNDCDFQVNTVTASTAVRHFGNQGNTIFNNCTFYDADFCLLAGIGGQVTAVSIGPLTFNDCIFKDSNVLASISDHEGTTFNGCKFKNPAGVTYPFYISPNSLNTTFNDCRGFGIQAVFDWMLVDAGNSGFHFNHNDIAPATAKAVVQSLSPITGAFNKQKGTDLCKAPTNSFYSMIGEPSTYDMLASVDAPLLDADKSLMYEIVGGTTITIDGIENGQIDDVLTVYSTSTAATGTFTYASGTVGATEILFPNTAANKNMTGRAWAVKYVKTKAGWVEQGE